MSDFDGPISAVIQASIDEWGKLATEIKEMLTLCAICDEPIADPDDPDLCHWGHEEDCPNLTDPDAGIICACDINYHPACCPVCNGPEEESEEE